MDPKKERFSEDEDPFKDLKIGNWMILEDISERQPCLNCKKSRKYFCYNCYIPVQDVQGHVPKVKLPIKIDIIKHSREIDGKSTAAHAAVLAPDDVNIYTYPCIPDYGSDERVVLVFPGRDAISVENLFDSPREMDEPKAKKLNVGVKFPVTRAVFIDSTWNQSRGIYKDQRVRDLPCVVLQSRISQFWRHQNGSPRWYLATIEAIHQFLVEFIQRHGRETMVTTMLKPHQCKQEKMDKRFLHMLRIRKLQMRKPIRIPVVHRISFICVGQIMRVVLENKVGSPVVSRTNTISRRHFRVFWTLQRGI